MIETSEDIRKQQSFTEQLEQIRNDLKSAKEKTIQLIIERDNGRATRLEEFVKAELREMNIVARNQFIVNVFLYLEPEINALHEQGKLR